VHNYPPRWNGAPNQELLVIRRNHKAGEVALDPLRWGLIPYRCGDPHELMRPFPASLMRMWPISTRVNKPENDDASILEPVELAH
jgi:putative SOS response-associated peptidase YedK